MPQKAEIRIPRLKDGFRGLFKGFSALLGPIVICEGKGHEMLGGVARNRAGEFFVEVSYEANCRDI
jgi:hypothetical protein